MKIVATIEARMTSTRLPGKSMKKILGKPMLQIMIERLKNCKTLNDIVIATTDNVKDDEINDLAKKMNVKCFRGSENDVLDRVLKAAQSSNADIIVELWGDAPLVDPNILDYLTKYYLENKFDCVGTVMPNFKRTYPVGISALMFPTKILQEVDKKTQNPIDRENVSNYIYEHPEEYDISPLPCPDELNFPHIRFEVDEQNDFDVVSKIYENLYPINPNFTTLDIINFLNSNPHIRDSNKHVVKRRLPTWDKFKV